jgi:histidinol-phosphate aminotransferase
MTSVLSLARPDILTLQPYSHAAWLPSLERLHANEMPWRAEGDASAAGLNRYPEPQPPELIERLAELYGVGTSQLLAGRGSDEAIDLLVRAFCRAGEDSVILCPPTFGMYKVAARIQGAGVIEVPLLKDEGFALDRAGILKAWKPQVKIVFLCSPNNPTGNLLDPAEIERLCSELDGKALVAVDEAYVEFADTPGFTRLLPRYPNLVTFRTLSKAYALAGARCGVLLAHPEIVSLLKRIIPPYALPSLTVEAVMQLTAPENRAAAAAHIGTLLVEREKLSVALRQSSLIRRVWPSDANFLLVECTDAERVLAAVRSVQLIIRDQRAQPMLPGCLRITIGTPEQNRRLLAAIEAAGNPS